MRLIHSKTFELEQFGDDVPPYAILSHTWQEEEVSFGDMCRNPTTATRLKGWSKIRKSAEFARRDGIEYIWIDTCCIDKSSSAELSEAINSMFRWYQQAAVCYAFLSDVLLSLPSSAADHLAQKKKEDQLKASRYFTRGWTLQELIAPPRMEFYDGSWQFLGSKRTSSSIRRTAEANSDELSSTETDSSPTQPSGGSDFLSILARCSDVPAAILGGRQSPATRSVAQRMSWAARRQTTRQEDLAYCLMGLFDIHMPLLYGEGRRNAFVRLQEEIIKRTDDESLFAWRLPPPLDETWDIAAPETSSTPPFSGLLAPSPACFSDGCNVVSDSWRSVLPSIATNMTNRGLQMEARLARVPADSRSSSSMYYWAFLSCRSGPVAKSFYLILLQRLGDGEQIFTRARPDILARLGKRDASRRISVHLINDDNSGGSDQYDPEEKKAFEMAAREAGEGSQSPDIIRGAESTTLQVSLSNPNWHARKSRRVRRTRGFAPLLQARRDRPLRPRSCGEALPQLVVLRRGQEEEEELDRGADSREAIPTGPGYYCAATTLDIAMETTNYHASCFGRDLQAPNDHVPLW